MKTSHGVLVLIVAFLSFIVWPGRLPAQPREAPYDGLRAGLEAYHYHEAQRRREINEQLGIIDRLKRSSAMALPEDETIYYNHGPSRESLYAYPRRGPLRRSRGRRYVFEPWPTVLGDIWGYQTYTPVRQPIGQRHVRTGPNRWESHPVYAPPILPEPAAVSAPTETPVPSMPPAPPDPPRASDGPREF